MGPDMPVYVTLNDVARIGPGLADFDPGDTEIWYAHLANIVTSQPLIHAVTLGWRPTVASVNGTVSGFRYENRNYSLLGKIRATDKSRIFFILQGEIWSPRGEARNLIRERGLLHTSMSVGDVVIIDGRGWICCPIGWEELKP